MKKEELIAKVQDSLGSLFTKDDVVNCLNMVVEEKPKVEETKADFEAILNLIKNRIEETIDNFDFNDSDNFDITEFEFDIRYGNQIEVDSYEVDAHQQKRNLLDTILEAFNELEEEHETRMEIIAEQKEAVEEN